MQSILKLTATVLLLLSVCTLRAQVDTSTALERIRQDVMALADDSMGGRPPGGMYELKAARYISEQFSQVDILRDIILFKAYSDKDTLTCSNIIGYIDNKADSTIIIGAHYDHLGMGGSKSRDRFAKGIHHGADDNASGVALMLELARNMASNSVSRRYNYMFVAFSAHEIGLYGSANFTRTEYFKQLKVKLYLNFDMVGRLDSKENKVRASYCKGQQSMKGFFDTDTTSGIVITTDEDNTINDYTIFCEAGVPAISITTGLHSDYHRTGDTADKINYQGIVQIFELLKERLSLLH